MSQHITVAAAAEFLACSPRTIRRRIADGTISTERDGRIDLDRLRHVITGERQYVIEPPNRPTVRIERGGLIGAKPGTSGVAHLEHTLRDELAADLDGCTEPRLPYGRADIATATHVIEVEPLRSWRHGIRQALAYAAQCQLTPGLALFGAATADDVLAMHLRLRPEQRSHAGPHLALWWHTGCLWVRVTARRDCRAMLDPRTVSKESSPGD